jgi:MFS family permease
LSNFIFRNINLLTFGFFAAFASGFGQTFFISLFSNDFRSTFDLSNTQFGSIYSIATILSAITIIWAGKLIDVVPLRRYTLIIIVCLAATCFMASLVFHVAMLFITIYCLRLFGQGLISHTSRTTMARYFDQNRGKALAISGFGFSFGEMIFPSIIVFLILLIGWRMTWLTSSVFILLFFGTLFFFLLRNKKYINETIDAATSSRDSISWRRRDVLKDKKFYFYLPISLIMSFTVTGFLFHQVFIAEINNWKITDIAHSFIYYAIAGISGSIIGGLLVDKFKARNLIPFYLLPMMVIFFVMLFSNNVLILFLYMAGLGLSNGLNENIANSLWAELYGIKNLGAIRAMLTFFGVLASAASPFLYGMILDKFHNIYPLIIMGIVSIISFSFLGYYGKRFN